ncbi:phosphoribosyl pyrophosphate (PRPP) synthase 3 [Hibiscus trionum]|uniref:Phosphoribosyl pyrophosphate (PRPP) synthase 3 n=1 Tax=Hibiscus trionum TaxID=183268 RepID=A0A9W7J4X7_HIBTR|nr:phosphoribosyl pyrophosphate (PRPP) synthase 3 [Hibiscus trionum]
MAVASPPLTSSLQNRINILSDFTSFKPFSNSGKKCSRFRSSMSMIAAASATNSAIKPAKKVCLFYCTETEVLAQRIAAESDAIQLRNINWRTFDDGFPNLFIPNAHGIRGHHVTFLASFSSPAVIFEQLSRMEDEGDVATTFTLARILSHIPTSRGGPTSLVTFDIHALQERFYFGDNILPCFESGIPLLKNRLQQLPDSDKISIAFPDDGAWKRFHKQLQHFPTIVCNKVGMGDQRIVRIKEGDATGRHVVIVDDLVQSGMSWQRFQHDNGGHPEKGLAYFWITDSCPHTVKEVNSKLPFQILTLSASIAAALQI